MLPEKLRALSLDEAQNSSDLESPKSIPQRRSNSTPITTTSLSERLSLLRNSHSPASTLLSSRGMEVVTSLHMSPPLSPSTRKSSLGSSPITDFNEFSLSSSASSLEIRQQSRLAGIHKLLKTLSINSLLEINNNEVKSSGVRSPIHETVSSALSPDVVDVRLMEKQNFIPSELVDPGIELLRITHKKKVKRCFQFDTNKNVLKWNNKSSSMLTIEKIKNIRVGDDAKNYREEFKVSSEYKDLWITIIYFNDSRSNNLKALHVLATLKYDYDIFLSTLKLLVFVNRDLLKNISLGSDSDLFTNFHWNNYVMNVNRFNKQIVDTPATKISQTLNAEGVLRLSKRLNINIDEIYLISLFHKCDIDHNGYLDFEEFKNFVSLLRTRLEINDIFQMITDNDRINFDQFYKFLIEIQQEDYTHEFIQKIFHKFADSEDYLTMENFQNFLKSSYTSPIVQTAEDFSRPINEYYISSSHNTYLLGRQFAGDSSIEGYIRVLQRSCRCIEIDLWDGQLENGEKGPIVKHGRSFTTAVSLKDVLQAIKKYAFISTPFPLIISLEINCNAENQLIMQNLLIEVLGEMLVLEPMMSNSMRLPSPNDLKHRILLKVKKTEANMGSWSFMYGVSSSTNSTTSSASSISEDNLSKPVSRKMFNPKPTTKIIPEVSSMGIYLSNIKFRNFSLPESKTYNHCFSFSEKTVNKMMKDPIKLQSILKHNKRYFARLYPSKYRYNSTNFNPIQYWALGFQMVATNWQMYDLGQQLNEAMFLVGTCSGYVLKPVSLRGQNTFQNERHRIKLNIDIISAQQLPTPKDYVSAINPYIEFEIYGYDSVEYTDDKTCTKVVKANGFNPIWQESFQREIITSTRSLVFVRLLVKMLTDDSNVLVGVCVLNLLSVKRGYRHLTIYDLQGEEFIFAKLFVKIDYDQQLIK